MQRTPDNADVKRIPIRQFINKSARIAALETFDRIFGETVMQFLRSKIKNNSERAITLALCQFTVHQRRRSWPGGLGGSKPILLAHK